MREIIEFQLMELGIPRNELNEMSDDQVIRKWVIGLELADRRKNAVDKAKGHVGNTG